MTPYALTDIVNSATPLETQFDGVHPRLYLTDAGIEAVRAKTIAEPWKSFQNRVIAFADAGTKRGFAPSDFKGDMVGYGCTLTSLVVAFRMTRESRFLEAARACMGGMLAIADWTVDLQYGHWTHGMALAYDWLHHHLDESTLARIREALVIHTERTFKYWMTYKTASSVCYAWNHTAIPHSGFITAGCALWGEVEGPGRWLRMGVEKLRLLMGALGLDGASAEGHAYGQYHVDFLLRTLLLADQLLGEDFFQDSQFLRNYPSYMVHSMLPAGSWRTNPDGPGLPAIAFVQVGDSTFGHHWHGPDYDLRIVARAYRNPYAMWLANQTAAASVCGDTSCFLNLICHDESITAVPPDAIQPFHHLVDKDIVLMRSGWEADAAMAVVKCGPNSGYHAARHYRHNISGGHMHPDAGHLMIHAFGEWLLREDGYKRKMTAYHNTILVNGVGQTGEGGLWFEDLEMRRGKPEGRIVRAEHHAAYDLVTADATPAYPVSAGLKRFLRHVVYLRPRLWVVIDELETEADAMFEQRFHGSAPFGQVSENSWSSRVERGSLDLILLGPTPLKSSASRYVMRGHGGHIPDEHVDLLAVSNAVPTRSALFVTVLGAQEVQAKTPVTARVIPVESQWRIQIESETHEHRLLFRSGQAVDVDILTSLESSLRIV